MKTLPPGLGMTKELFLLKLEEIHHYLLNETRFFDKEFVNTRTEDEAEISFHIAQAADAILQIIEDLECGDNLAVYKFEESRDMQEMWNF